MAYSGRREGDISTGSPTKRGCGGCGGGWNGGVIGLIVVWIVGAVRGTWSAGAEAGR